MREDRGRFLDALDLRGRTVLDLGSNLGEISREARARGAALVDGFEIDPYFNEIAQLVNVLTGTTGVSFYERDMADPATYGEPYDVVLAFSAFRFIAGCLDRLAAITDVLVVETHELKGNFDERYLAPLTEHFPAFRMLGESDVERLRAGGVRAVGVFARDETALLGALAPELRSRRAGGGRAGSRRARAAHPRHGRRAASSTARGCGSAAGAGTRRRPTTPSSSRRPQMGPRGAPFGTLAVTEPSAGSEFEFDCEAPLADSPLHRLDVSAFARATRSARCRPTGRRPASRAIWSASTVAHGLLEPLGRYRALDSFEAALDWIAGRLPQRCSSPLLPNARACDGPPMRFDDGEFDLVIARGAAVRGGLRHGAAPGHAAGRLPGAQRSRRACAPIRRAGDQPGRPDRGTAPRASTSSATWRAVWPGCTT